MSMDEIVMTYSNVTDLSVGGRRRTFFKSDNIDVLYVCKFQFGAPSRFSKCLGTTVNVVSLQVLQSTQYTPY